MGKIVRRGINFSGGGGSISNPTASSVTFDNTDTGLAATNVQDAVTEVNGKLKMTDSRFNNSIAGAAYAGAGITSVLGCAKQYSPYGISYIITGETSTDLPDTTYKYGMGIVLKRTNDQITILLFSNIGNKIAVNNYYGTTWSGWKPLLS